MTRRLTAAREEWRQRRHHRAFRIAPPPWDDSLREQAQRLLAGISETGECAARATDEAPTARAAAGTEPADALSEVNEKALAEAATHLWRAQRRLDQQDETSSVRSRQTGRYLRTCREALTDAGLVVQEHDGDAFHSGRSLEVLVFQDDPSLATETVLQTVRPTIYFRGRRIQMGQVIVGSPPAGGTDTHLDAGTGTEPSTKAHGTDTVTEAGTGATAGAQKGADVRAVHDEVRNDHA